MIDEDELPPLCTEVEAVMPWREMTSADLRTMARLTVESVEAFIACGEDVPESIRIDLSALISVDECPFDLRARAARLVRGFPN